MKKNHTNWNFHKLTKILKRNWNTEISVKLKLEEQFWSNKALQSDPKARLSLGWPDLFQLIIVRVSEWRIKSVKPLKKIIHNSSPPARPTTPLDLKLTLTPSPGSIPAPAFQRTPWAPLQTGVVSASLHFVTQSSSPSCGLGLPIGLSGRVQYGKRRSGWGRRLRWRRSR